MGDAELESVVKASTSAMVYADGDGADATRLLMSQYDATPAAGGGALRTPRVATGGGGDVIMQEAAAQAAFAARETPLVGGESVPLEQLGDFSSLTPRAQVASTPNPLLEASGATPARGGGGGATPSAASDGGWAGSSRAPSEAVGRTPGATPGRDALGINEGGGALGGGNLAGLPPALRQRLERERRAAVGAQLSMLPAPQNGARTRDARTRMHLAGYGGAVCAMCSMLTRRTHELGSRRRACMHA